MISNIILMIITIKIHNQNYSFNLISKLYIRYLCIEKFVNRIDKSLYIYIYIYINIYIYSALTQFFCACTFL